MPLADGAASRPATGLKTTGVASFSCKGSSRQESAQRASRVLGPDARAAAADRSRRPRRCSTTSRRLSHHVSSALTHNELRARRPRPHAAINVLAPPDEVDADRASSRRPSEGSPTRRLREPRQAAMRRRFSPTVTRRRRRGGLGPAVAAAAINVEAKFREGAFGAAVGNEHLPPRGRVRALLRKTSALADDAALPGPAIEGAGAIMMRTAGGGKVVAGLIDGKNAPPPGTVDLLSASGKLTYPRVLPISS